MRHYPILVAIETDATRYHGEHAQRPDLLDKGDAEQMLAHVASDLSNLIPGLRDCSLAMAGALFDQTQVLQPGYPLYRALESLIPPLAQPGEYQSRLCSLGAEEGRMPVAALRPSESVTPALLQVLPILVGAPEADAASLFDQMEHRFLEEGQLSAHAAKGLEAAFGIRLNHARFMTLTDLNAMLRMQLDHFGFLSLWELLDAALERQSEPQQAAGSQGTGFRWDGQRVMCRFETFDYWAREGAGKTCAASAEARVLGYSRWTREYRQFLVTLGAHAVPVEQHLPEQEETLDGSFMTEDSSGTVSATGAAVTEHSSGELGTIAVTVAAGDSLLNFYPLHPEGLNDLHAHLRSTGLASGAISFPGSICLDKNACRLAQDRL